jgi:hypothetical protein
MANRFLVGATGKFAESFGSGLAYGIVTVAAIGILKFWFLKDDPIVRMTDPVKVCSRDARGNNCIVNVDCDKDKEEIVIGGECTVEDSHQKQVGLINFAISTAAETENTPRRFSCAWDGAAANEQPLMIPRVRAVCISKSRFGYRLPFGS